jgi:hypothetical protein
MKNIFSLAAGIGLIAMSSLAANDKNLETYSPDLNKVNLISCKNSQIENKVVTALPLKSGALMIPLNNADLTRYTRVSIKITALSVKFKVPYFAAALRGNRKYYFARFARKPVIKGKKTFQLTFNIAKLPRKNVDFLRLYFNRLGDINKTVKFKIEKVKFYGGTMAHSGNVSGKKFSLNLGEISLISCKDSKVEDQIITALPQRSGAIMIPLNNSDLIRYDRIKIKVTPLSAKFKANCFLATLRSGRQYFPTKFVRTPKIETNKSFEMIFDMGKLPRKNVDFLRLYFNHTGNIDKTIKFKLDSVDLYQAEMLSEVPREKYHRKLSKTLIFPRIQIKYSLFLNYLSVPFRDVWIERPLLFNRELVAGTKEFKKEGNLASFKKNADLVSTYMDGFSILATSKSYLQRTLASMQYADKLGRKNFIMLEISPAVTQLGKNAQMSCDYDFIFKIAKAAEKSPSAFRINDKVVLSSYNSDLISPQQWIPIIEKLKKQANGKLLFITEIRTKFYDANYAYLRNGGKISPEKINEMKDFIRSYLDVADGMLFAGCNHIVKSSDQISSYKFGDKFYKDILIPTIISVFNEPKYQKKYLGLSAAKGYFYTLHAAAGQNEGGTATLRQSLDAALSVNPDFIIMPEWNEANENTHIEPTVFDSFSSRRVINHYRGISPPANDNRKVPNLIISYRSELVYGETLRIELLNLPDLKYSETNTKIELCLKTASGKVLKKFAPLFLSNRKLDEKYIEFPVEDFCNERVIVPELVIFRNGKRQLIKGLSCIMLNAPPTMNKKFVKQPIRDLCVLKKSKIAWHKTKGKVAINGFIETEDSLNTVELLENNIPVAAVDLKKEYKCPPEEILLRFFWNSRSTSRAIKCTIKPLSGTVDTLNGKYIAMTETKNGKTSKVANYIQKSLRFTSHIDEFFFKASNDSILEIDSGGRKFRCSLKEIVKYGIYRKVFANGDTISIEQVRRLPQVPYPINKKHVEFNLKAKSIFPCPVYTLRAITASGRIFRSTPFCPEKLSGDKVKINVWSYSKQKVVSLKIPKEYGRSMRYDFTSSAGDILPSSPDFRIFYGKLGGFDNWTRAFNKTGSISTPAWKKEDKISMLEFDGKGNYMSLPSRLISEQSFTLKFSIRPMVNSKQVVFQTYSSPHPGFQLVLQNGELSGYFLNRKGKSFKFKTNTRLRVKQWNDIEIVYDMINLSIKINNSQAELFSCNGLLYRQPCLVFGGTYLPQRTHRFKGFLRSLSYANYLLEN